MTNVRVDRASRRIGQPAGRPGADRPDVDQRRALLQPGHPQVLPAQTPTASVHDTHGSRWSWWVSADSDEGTAEGLLAYGAEQTTDIPVMAIDVLTVNDAEAPSDLKISMVTHRAEMRAYSGPLGFSADNLGDLVGRETGLRLPRRGPAARRRRRQDRRDLHPVARHRRRRSLLHRRRPHYRRRGIATALTRRRCGSPASPAGPS